MCYRTRRGRITPGGFSHYAKHTHDFAARGPFLRNAPGASLRVRANWGRVCAAAGTHPPRPCRILLTEAGCVPEALAPLHAPGATLQDPANWGRVRIRAPAPPHTRALSLHRSVNWPRVCDHVPRTRTLALVELPKRPPLPTRGRAHGFSYLFTTWAVIRTLIELAVDGNLSTFVGPFCLRESSYRLGS